MGEKTLKKSILLFNFLLVSILLSLNSCANSDDKTKPKTILNLSDISNTNPELSHAIVDPALISVVIPPGLMGEEPKGHSYIRTERPSNEVPIYAPVEMDLVGGAFYSSGTLDANGDVYPVYIMDFAVSKEVNIWIDHVYQPVDVIVSAFPNFQEGTVGNFLDSPIRFSKGDLIGYAQPRDSSNTSSQFDFGLRNTSQPNAFIRPSLMTESFLYSACPYDYFSEDLKTQYQALYGDELPVENARCRSINVDVAGSLSGFWYESESDVGLSYSDYFGVGEAVDTDYIQGTLFDRYMPKGNSKSPQDVSVGDIVCYSDVLTDRHVVFELQSLTQMRVAYSTATSTCPSGFPSTSSGYDHFQTYYR